MAFKVPSYNSYTNEFNYRNPYAMHLGSLSDDTQKLLNEGRYKWSQFPEIPENRTGMQRAFDVLSAPNYAVAGAVDALVTGHNPVKAFGKGLVSGLNFVSDAPMYEQKTFSNVLEDAGWKPTSLGGRISKGATGFILDVLLDPTTYLSGGTSALARGAGKASLDVLAKDFASQLGKKHGFDIEEDLFKVPQQVFESVKKKATDAGITEDMATRYAQVEAKRAETELAPYLGGMTEDKAKAIIQSHAEKHGYQIDEAQLNADAAKLTDKFNKAIGFQASHDGISLSLGNAPLINRLFPKSWRNASVTLAKGEDVAKFSDNFGLSSAYNSIRRSIYGSKLGKLFSTKSGVYTLAKNSPDEFYDIVRYANHTLGLNIDKTQREAMIYEKVKQLKNLTPAEQKNIVDALQDKRTFAKVDEVVKFADGQEAEMHKKELEARKQTLQGEVDALTKEKEHIDMLISAHHDNIANTEKGAQVLRDEYRQKLVDLKNNHLLDETTKTKLIHDMLQEVHDVEENVITKYENMDFANDKNLQDEFNRVARQVEANDEGLRNEIALYHGNVTRIENDFKVWESNRKRQEKELRKQKVEVDEKITPNTHHEEVQRIEAKLAHNAHIDEQIQALRNGNPDRITDKRALLDKLGEYIFGDKNYFTLDTYQNKIDELVAMVNKHVSEADMIMKKAKKENWTSEKLQEELSKLKPTSKDELKDFVDENAEFYSGKAKIVYSYIGQQIGYGHANPKYKNWDEYYNKRIESIAGEVLTKLKELKLPKYDKLKVKDITKMLKDGGKSFTNLVSMKMLDQQQINVLSHLAQQRLKRTILVKSFENMSLDEVKQFQLNEINKQNLKEVEHLLEDPLWEERRKRMYDEQSAMRNQDAQLTSHEMDMLDNINVRYHYQIKNIEKQINELRRTDIVDQERIAELEKQKFDLHEWRDEQIKSVYRTSGQKTVKVKVTGSDKLSKEEQVAFDKLKTTYLEKIDRINARIEMVKSDSRFTIDRDKILQELESGRERLRKQYIEESKKYEKQGEFYDRNVSTVEGKDFTYDEFKEKKKFEVKFSDKQKNRVISDFITFFPPSDVKASYPFYQQVVTQVERLLTTNFRKPYDRLDTRERKMLFFAAYKSALAKLEGKGVKNLKIFNADKAKKLEQEIELDRVASIQKQIKPDSMVTIIEKPAREVMTHTGEKKLKDAVTGEGHVVEAKKDAEGAVLYTIEKADGTRVELPASRISKVHPDKPKEATDAIIESPVTREIIEERAKIYTRITEIKHQMDLSKHEFNIKRGNFVDEYINRNQDMKKVIADMEVNLHKLNNAKMNLGDVDGKLDEIKKIDEKLASDDAFETIVSTKKEKTFKYEGIVLDYDLSLSEKEKEIIKELRQNFIDMGKAEVSIGKLNVRQFESMMNRYVPHILTDDGQDFLNHNELKWDGTKLIAVPRDIEKKGSYVTQDLGYGTVYNNHAHARTLKSVYIDGKWVFNPTIDEINKAVAPLLKGKNLFSENIADIYLARALKNNDLIYDNNYMHNMMITFGKTHTPGKVEDGYKVVMNYGKFKEFGRSVASVHVSMEISNAVSGHVRELYADARANHIKLTEQQVSESIRRFIASNYSKETLKQMYNNFTNDFYKRVGIQNADNFDATATPMVELSVGQGDTVHQVHSDMVQGFLNQIDVIRKKVTKEWKESMGALPEEHFKRELDKMDRLERWMSKLTRPQVVQVNEVIVNKANAARKNQMFKNSHWTLQLYDKFTHLLKLNMTTIMPSFHARNKMANTFLNWLGVGGHALNPTLQKEAWKAVLHNGDAEKVTGRFEIRKSDDVVESMTYADAYLLAKQHGVVDEGFFAKDIGAGAETKGIKGGKFDPTDSKDFIGYKVGASVGRQIENSDRFLHFIARLKMGDTPEQAAESVEKYLFDYSDLTAFEQHVMKRILPFYTFMRKNGALQLHELLYQPKKFQLIAKMMNGIEGMTNPEDRLNKGLVNEFAKDWIQTPFATINPAGNREPIMLNPNLPFQEFSRTPNPLHPIQSMINLFTQANPIIKVPIEETLNHNTYFNQPIVGENDNQITPRLDHILSQTAWYNAGKDLATKHGGDLGLEVLNNTTGIKALSYDYEQLKNLALKDYYDEKNSPINAYKRKLLQSLSIQ